MQSCQKQLSYIKENFKVEKRALTRAPGFLINPLTVAQWVEQGIEEKIDFVLLVTERI